jgi:sodium transport system permease protein
MKQEAASRDVSETEWGQFRVELRNLATSKQMGAFLMGLMLPLFLVIMVALGSFYPAIDATAGERERGTWETLMTVAARRSSIVTAKFLYVATLGSVAGLLNVAAMVLSMKAIFAPLLGRLGEGEGGFEFQFPWAAVPVVVVGAVLLALFASAGMMILACFARTFKEGQSMVTPFYLLLFLPVLLLQGPGVEFTPALAVIPVANLLMALREAIAGRFDLPLLAITLVVELVTIGLCLRLAAYILQFENVLVGSYGGSLLKFLRDRVSGRRGGGE